MITVDRRTGSGELIDLYPRSIAKLGHLEYADMAFTGNGPESQWLIGLERKRLSDLMSSMASKRFSGHQLIGLSNAYNQVYIIVEGIWRPNPDNHILEVRKGKCWVPLRIGQRSFTYGQMVKWLNTMAVIQGFMVAYTSTPLETVLLSIELHSWWVNKQWSDHKSHRQMYSGHSEVLLHKSSFVRRVVGQLTGVEEERSRDIDRVANSVWDVIHWTEAEWRNIPGIGKKLSKSIYNEFRGEGGR